MCGSSIARADGNGSGEPGLRVQEPGLRVQETSHQGRSRRSHECCRAHCGERSNLVLSSEDERLSLPSLLVFGVSGRSRQRGRAGRERL